MGKDFDGQSRHVVDAAVRRVVAAISAAGPLLRSGDVADLSDLRGFLLREAAGGLSRSQRNSWESRDTVDLLINFIRLDI